MFRMKGRKSPHNLYSNVSELYALAPADRQAPQPQFEYRASGTTSKGGDPVVAVKLGMDGTDVDVAGGTRRATRSCGVQ